MKKLRVFKNQKKTIRVDRPGRYVVELVGEGAEAQIVGAFEGKGRSDITIDIEVRHKAAHTTANTHIRGVLWDRARARITGTIKVYPGAQQTNSFLTEKVLLLGEEARAEAVPNLEIEANDVKCSHAATVGKIDEEQLFYLQTRGLPRQAAERVLVEGFLEPVALATRV